MLDPLIPADVLKHCWRPVGVIEAHISIYRAISEGRLAKVTNTVERVLGRKPMTFDQWVQENASTFARLCTAS